MKPLDILFIVVVSACASLLTWTGLRLLFRRQRISQTRKMLEALGAFDRATREETLGTLSGTDSAGRLLTTRYGIWFRSKALRAGIWDDDELVGLIQKKMLAAIVSFILIALLAQFFKIHILMLTLIPLASFLVPDIFLIRRASDRAEAITQILPETIDLLAMCVSAGLGFHAGLQRIAQSDGNPLSREFNRVISEMKLGQGRSEAFISMSDRLNIEPLREFVTSVIQMDRLGVPISKVLEEQSLRMRTMRRENAREQAQKLPVKILAPIMLLMLPALLIIVLGPAVVSISRSFG